MHYGLHCSSPPTKRYAMRKDKHSWYQPIIAFESSLEGADITYIIMDTEVLPAEPQTQTDPAWPAQAEFGKVWVKGDLSETEIEVSKELKGAIEEHILWRAETD